MESKKKKKVNLLNMVLVLLSHLQYRAPKVGYFVVRLTISIKYSLALRCNCITLLVLDDKTGESTDSPPSTIHPSTHQPIGTAPAKCLTHVTTVHKAHLPSFLPDGKSRRRERE